MLCPSCKKEIQSGSKFCSFCGYQISNEKQISEQQDDKSRNKWKYLLAVLCLVGGIWYYQAVSLSADEETAYKAMEACAYNFKNPSSLRLLECYVSDNGDIAVRVQAENGFGAHISSCYVFQQSGTIVGDVINGVDVGRTLLDCAKLTDRKVEVDKINKKFQENHRL